MKITIKTAIIFAFIWMMIKISFLGMGKAHDLLKIAVIINILCLLLSISVGLYLQKRKDTEETSALKDVKNGMGAGVIYTVIVSFFIYLYYSKIDLDFNKHQIAEQEILLEKTINNPSDYKKLKESNESFETMSDKQLKIQIQKNIRATYSPQSVTTVALLGMLLLTTINSIFVTAVYRKVVFTPKAMK
ncbi:MAG: DUF4199 domain-containing protein [Flavobacteriia bacterium]|nr:DUF4199 domain-containing protein [Flavobacteriia bacterium]